jgi:hypothetical protein
MNKKAYVLTYSIIYLKKKDFEWMCFHKFFRIIYCHRSSFVWFSDTVYFDIFVFSKLSAVFLTTSQLGKRSHMNGRRENFSARHTSIKYSAIQDLFPPNPPFFFFLRFVWLFNWFLMSLCSSPTWNRLCFNSIVKFFPQIT